MTVRHGDRYLPAVYQRVPGLRIQLLLRSMLGTRWDAKTWPTIKAELKKPASGAAPPS